MSENQLKALTLRNIHRDIEVSVDKSVENVVRTSYRIKFIKK